MTTATDHIKHLLRQHWDGSMWYGSSLQHSLRDTSWEKAFYQPANFTHNIYEYVMHLVAWRKFVPEHLLGNSSYTIALNSEQDWPTRYSRDEVTWLKALASLAATQTALLAALDHLPDTRLDEPVPGKSFTWYAMLHGLLHHDIYHSAQIALLKK